MRSRKSWTLAAAAVAAFMLTAARADAAVTAYVEDFVLYVASDAAADPIAVTCTGPAGSAKVNGADPRLGGPSGPTGAAACASIELFDVAGGAGADTINLGDPTVSHFVSLFDVVVDAGADADVVTGTTIGDFLDGGPGDDTLHGRGGEDFLVFVGTIGDDMIAVTAPSGTLTTTAERDEYTDVEHFGLLGLGGNDTLTTGAGHDVLDGGLGNDVLTSGEGYDELYGDEGDDELNGGGLDDFLLGDVGADELDGGAGDDFLAGGDGVDQTNGGADTDHLSFSGSTGNDVLDASADAGTLSAGSDTEIYASVEEFFISGGDGDDTITTGAGSDVLDGGSGLDRLSAGGGEDFLDGGPDADLLEGGPGEDGLFGGSGDASDTLGGGSESDVLDGEGGNDSLDGGDGADLLAFAGSAGNDTLDATNTTGALTAGAERVTYTSVENFSLDGGAGDDVLKTGPGGDELVGGGGRDELDSGAGDDFLDSVDQGVEATLVEQVYCGPGHDLAFGDPADVRHDCEDEGEEEGFPPENTSPPAVSGNPQVGQTLAAAPGTWMGATSFAYQWQRCASETACADVPGATGASYVVTDRDVGSRMRIRVTATNEDGSTHAFSALTAPVAPLPPPPPPPPAVDTAPPNTRLTGSPPRSTRARTARFTFASTEPGSRFQCKLDRGRWSSCRSPKRYRNLRKGQHTFSVRAVDAAGNVDPTPAKKTWRIR